MIEKVRIVVEDEDLDIEFESPDIARAIAFLREYKPVKPPQKDDPRSPMDRVGSRDVIATAHKISKVLKDRGGRFS